MAHSKWPLWVLLAMVEYLGSQDRETPGFICCKTMDEAVDVIARGALILRGLQATV